MDYERIHKVQMGIISPSKLRMMLLRRRDGACSSRASPSKLEDTDFADRNLLAGNLDDEGFQTQSSSENPHSKGNSDAKHTRNQNSTCNSSHQPKHGGSHCTVHPMKLQEVDDNGGDVVYNFEFPRGGKTSPHPTIGPFSRHLPSKWNDAEKWLVNRKLVQENGFQKNNSVHYQCNRQVNSGNSNSQSMTEKFSFVSQSNGDSASLNRLSNDFNHKKSSFSTKFPSETMDNPVKQLISMRDVGTEMTPIPSQEASRTETPIGNLTPFRSPTSSIPSSPGRRLVPADLRQCDSEDERDERKGDEKVELSGRELLMKTKQEIAALGLQLGKLNIASWASKEFELNSSFPKAINGEEEVKHEYEARAIAWEEAEKSKHLSRYKREETKIQAWESHQRAKYEARMRKIEIQAANMRSRAGAALAEKLSTTDRRVEEKRSRAEATLNLQAEITSKRADRIRRSGRVPTHRGCCKFFP